MTIRTLCEGVVDMRGIIREDMSDDAWESWCSAAVELHEQEYGSLPCQLVATPGVVLVRVGMTYYIDPRPGSRSPALKSFSL